MGGLFGIVSREDCVSDLFYGTDYHSHLGTRRGGIAVRNSEGMQRSIHNIENSYFRTKFEGELASFWGNKGIGVISDTDPQPLLVASHLGRFGIVTVGRVNNLDDLVGKAFGRRAEFSRHLRRRGQSHRNGGETDLRRRQLRGWDSERSGLHPGFVLAVFAYR